MDYKDIKKIVFADGIVRIYAEIGVVIDGLRLPKFTNHAEVFTSENQTEFTDFCNDNNLLYLIEPINKMWALKTQLEKTRRII